MFPFAFHDTYPHWRHPGIPRRNPTAASSHVAGSAVNEIRCRRVPEVGALAQVLARSQCEDLCNLLPGAESTTNFFVEIGGIEQWITIRGEDRNNPVLLFLHGGPGDATNPWGYAAFRSWLKYFTVVQWDQRGSGRTFGRNGEASASTINPDRMIQDGIELSELLKKRLHKDKIVLVGHSWGSVLGFFMVKSRPDLFYAFVTGQVVANPLLKLCRRICSHCRKSILARELILRPWQELKEVMGLRRFKGRKDFRCGTEVGRDMFERADIFLVVYPRLALGSYPGIRSATSTAGLTGRTAERRSSHFPYLDDLDQKHGHSWPLAVSTL